jgi:16S rRNA (cytidine1402-2'-O)-methyltransferase
VVATPIGNLDDISLRALHSLASAEVIAAEDTRVTKRLLDHHRLSGKLVPVHAHNERRAADWIVEQLSQGKTVALVTDAGTPAVSDPGAAVVARVRDAGFRVVPVPGPNAAVTALSASGMADGPFLFLGFLPAKPGPRRKALDGLRAQPYTLVFYEAPHRVVASVEDMAAALGPERHLVIARELTKVFEQIHRCPLGEAAAWIRADPDRRRGEFVLVVEGGGPAKKSADPDWERVVETLLAELPLAHAVRLACQLTGASRKIVYARALQLSREAETRGPRA